MNMTNMLKLVMLVSAFASIARAQEGTVNVYSGGKQKWSASEVNRVYVSACTAVEREFGDRKLRHPNIKLVLGAGQNAVDFDKKTVLLRRWDQSLFAEGVVILAFEGILTPERRMIITNRAVSLAQATVNVSELAK